MKLVRVGMLATVLAMPLGCTNENKKVVQLEKSSVVQLEAPQASTKGFELKYISPEDKASIIQIHEDDGIVIQTGETYPVLPALLGGTLEVKAEPPGFLKHFNPDDSHEGFEVKKNYRPTFSLGSNRNAAPKLGGGLRPSTIFLAQAAGKTKVTVTFRDEEGNKKEETTYNIEITEKK